MERQLDLAVENVVWSFRMDFPSTVVKQARDRLIEFGFDPIKQQPI